jgi:hypothetical protein
VSSALYTTRVLTVVRRKGERVTVNEVLLSHGVEASRQQTRCDVLPRLVGLLARRVSGLSGCWLVGLQARRAVAQCEACSPARCNSLFIRNSQHDTPLGHNCWLATHVRSDRFDSVHGHFVQLYTHAVMFTSWWHRTSMCLRLVVRVREPRTCKSPCLVRCLGRASALMYSILLPSQGFVHNNACLVDRFGTW